MNIVYCFYCFLFGVLSSFDTCLLSTHKSHNLDGRPINFSTSLAFWLWRPNTRVRNPKLANDWESRNLMRRSWQKRRTFVTKKDFLPLIGWEDIARKFLSQSSRLVGVRQIYPISCQNLVGKYIYKTYRFCNLLWEFPLSFSSQFTENQHFTSLDSLLSFFIPILKFKTRIFICNAFPTIFKFLT